MTQSLMIVMYHYVRPLKGTHYSNLKALELEYFRGQLDFIQRHCQVVRMEEVIAAARGQGSLPPRAALLTFDDGYREHHEHVFPLLAERGLQGSFFPPACAVREGRVLGVNKIHFTLASGANPSGLVSEIFTAMDENRREYDLKDNADYFATYSTESRYDDPEVAFIKRILQKGLPEPLRAPLIDRLFRRFVTEDEKAFAAELYMSTDQLRELQGAGMFIGSHGDQHLWLNTLSPDDQRKEIDDSLDFLAELGVSTRDWVMCYPYGGYNDSLLTLLRERQCALGLTVDMGVADISRNDPLLLPRLDTNDVPHSLEATLQNYGWMQEISANNA
ncbi:Polysaccharide deacetylase [Modicisalibacter muralis]|uniref:Polysaccharide deacetylase n=1 Tax=Modicisalibacter muralis TaxID=119000 RepID=A0A1G9EWA0_9GAMM|nr:polysaccharide deacetylase family protein [Halomonas muralis]SDK80399.1 Polysaccharide deacetylase [Halomonas muralis]